jgi:Flp pilus assembly protein TadG
MRRIASLRGDQRGASLVEFALVLPVLLMLICGAIDLGYMYMAQTTLNGALMQAAQVASSSMEKPEADRLATLKSGIVASMAAYSGQQPTITATVYHSFGESFPEDYTDSNHNGKYDGPTPTFPGETFVDRNGNGKWDADAPVKTGSSTMGDVGDVVSYSASLKVRHLFGVIDWAALGLGSWGNGDADLKSFAVMRNEATKTV